MLSAEQRQWFQSFDRDPPTTSQPGSEFNLLAKARKWKLNGKTYSKRWNALSALPIAGPDNEADSDSDHYPDARIGDDTDSEDFVDLTARVDGITLANSPASSSLNSSAPMADEGSGEENSSEPDHLTGSIQATFDRLAKTERRTLNAREWDNYLADYLTKEVTRHLGMDTVTNLELLQALCSDLGVDPVPGSKTQCKKALKLVHVNIFDFLDCKRNGISCRPVFDNMEVFRSYTRREDKILPKKWRRRVRSSSCF